MNGRWKIIIFCLGVLPFVIFLFSRKAHRDEPAYHGKTLTQWLRQLDDGQASSGIGYPVTRRQLSRKQTEAAAAIRAMGTNALPLLIADLHAAPSPNSVPIRVREGMNSVERFSGYRVHFGFEGLTEEDRTRWRAAQGLTVLGPLAAAAAHDFERSFTNSADPAIKEAAYALAGIGSQGLKILTNAIKQAHDSGNLYLQWSCSVGIWALGQHPEAASNAIPLLINMAGSTNQSAASGATQVLGFIRADAEHVVPALSNAMNSSDPTISRDAAWALKQFGRQDVAKK